MVLRRVVVSRGVSSGRQTPTPSDGAPRRDFVGNQPGEAFPLPPTKFSGSETTASWKDDLGHRI